MLTILKIFLWSYLASANEHICEGRSPQSLSNHIEYCDSTSEDHSSLLCFYENTMGFENAGGIFGLPTGVCWWHSEFMRNATYLTYYQESCERWDETTKSGRRKINQALDKIIRNKDVVAIPGFKNLNHFTSYPYVQKLLQKKLQSWMGRDSFLYFQWVNGLVGQAYGPEHTKNIRKQKKILESLYQQVEIEKQIAYVMVQYSGVEAHAFLVFNIKRNLVEGDYHYEVSVQDSNYQSFYYHVNGEVVRLAKPYNKYVWNGRYWMNDHNYRFGYSKPEDFYLYLQKSKDLKKMLKVKSAFCTQKRLPAGCP